MSALPTFTRASTAYKEDGTSVASGVPRIESSGVKIEEGTTNVLPSPPVLTKYPLSEYTTEVVTEGEYTGWTKVILSCVSPSGLIAYLPVYPISVGTIRSFSIEFVSLTSKVTLTIAGGASAEMVVINGNRYSVTYTNSTTGNLYLGIYFISRGYKGQFVSETFYYRNVQYEDKAYATSFTPTTRLAETLEIPLSALSVTEGTIEFDYTPINQPLSDMITQFKSPKIMQIGDYWTINSVTLWRYPYNGVDMIRLSGNYSSGWILTGNATYSFSLLSKYRFSLRWKTANTFDLFINGVCIISNAISSIAFTSMGNIKLGEIYSSGGVNAIFSNIRISNKARSDTELAYTGDLSVDYNTTYLLPCKTSLAPKNF